jgi:hypothetical protein
LLNAALAKAPRGPDVPRDLTALHLDDFRAYGYGVAFGAEGMKARARLVLRPGPQGAGRVLDAIGKDCRFVSARLAPDDAIVYGASSFDLKTLYHAIVDLVGALSPSLGARWSDHLARARNDLGFDPIEEIVDQLGGEVGMFTPPPGVSDAASAGAGSSEFGYLIECRDGRRIRTALQQFERSMLDRMTPQGGQRPESPIERTDYLGHEVCAVKLGPGAAQAMPPTAVLPAWSVTDSWVLIASSADHLKGMLQRLSQREGRVFADTDAFAEARNLVPGPISGMSYADAARLMRTSLTQLQMLNLSLTMMSRGRIAPNYLDYLSMPDASVFERTLGPVVGVNGRDADGLWQYSVMRNPAAAAPSKDGR